MADIDKLFESIESDILSEDIKLSLGILYEQSLTEAIKAKETEMQATAATDLAKFKQGLTEQTDSFLNYFSEEFTKTNAPTIEDSVKVKLSEKIIKTFNTLMADFNMSMSEKTVSNEDELAEAKKECNKLTTDLLEAKQEIQIHKKAAIIVEHASTLSTDVQRNKLADYAKVLPLDKLFEAKVKEFSKMLLTEGKAFSKPVAKEKMDIVEKNETKLITEEQLKTAVDIYEENL